MGSTVLELPTGGFSFENYHRNMHLESKGFPVPKATKTGTTIVGIIYKTLSGNNISMVPVRGADRFSYALVTQWDSADAELTDGVILGADTRATEDTIVSDKNCSKIHFLASNIYCCGAGTAADTEMTTQMIASQLELHRLATDRIVPVVTANRMLSQMLFRYQGYIGAALVLGGVDNTGPHLYSIYPHGSSNTLPYVTMGSGSLAAMAIFEQRWKQDLELEEGKKLVRDAIAAGIFNDLGSGSNVDICIITKDGIQYLRPYEIANLKGQRQGKYRYARGTTATLNTRVIPLDVEDVFVKKLEDMDTSA